MLICMPKSSPFEIKFAHSFSTFIMPVFQCLEKVPIIIHKLRDEGTPQSGAFLKELTELIHDLMYQHTGFPELYDPILDLIKVDNQ